MPHKDIHMNYETVTMPAMIIVGATLRTTWKNNECYSTIPAFWEEQRRNNIAQKIPNKVYPDVIMGLYTDYTPDFSLSSGYYSLIIGCPVLNDQAIPKDMVVKKIPAATYAVFTAKGPFVDSIGKTWLVDIWQNKEIKRTFTYDFEWYDAKSTNDQNSIVKIYIAIK